MTTHAHHQHERPFYNRQRITDPAFFIGREREIEAIYSAVATRQCRSIVGERKIGKSSLLTYLSAPETLRAHGFDPDKYVFLYVDLEGMANITYDEFWPELLDKLAIALPAGQTDLRQRANDLSLQDEVRFMQVRRLLRRLDRAELTVVLMMDEFESLAANSEFNASFYGELRSLAGEMGVVYLTASKRSLYELTYQHADTLSSPFFNIFSEQRLGLLAAAEARSLLTTLSELPAGQPFTDAQVTALIELAGPHPFFLQVAGAYLFDLRREGETDPGTHLEMVTARFKLEAEDHFRYLWNQLTDQEQATLVQLDRAEVDAKRRLAAKALLRPAANGDYVPFSQAFAEFLSRTNPMLRTPTGVPRQNADLTGTTLGNYRVLSVIGTGGMAVVYKGYHSALDRYVAIKVMAQYLAGDPTFAERFQREASGIARLRHHNVVQLYDYNVHQDIPYMVMEYIEGETLKQRLLRARSEGARVPLAETVTIIRDIAAALDYAHAHQMVHRDVKPANILIRPEPQAAQLTNAAPYTGVLTDFGVARMLEGVQLTGTGATIGTPDYMSPEQAAGQPAQSSSDIYALGIILYEMLTGELPFKADTPVALLLKHMQAVPPSVIVKAPDLPLGVDQVLLQALAKDPADRYKSASLLAEGLSTALVGQL